VLGLRKSLSKGPVGLAFLPTMLFPFKREYPPEVQFPFRGVRPLYPRIPPECSRRKSRGKFFEAYAFNYASIFGPRIFKA
jgi:hypothetical protein